MWKCLNVQIEALSCLDLTQDQNVMILVLNYGCDVIDRLDATILSSIITCIETFHPPPLHKTLLTNLI